MKSFAKLGLLLALVVAGRLIRPTASPAEAAQAQVSPLLPTSGTFTAFSTEPSLLVAPVSQRSYPAPQQVAPDSLTWF